MPLSGAEPGLEGPRRRTARGPYEAVKGQLEGHRGQRVADDDRAAYLIRLPGGSGHSVDRGFHLFDGGKNLVK